MFVIDGFLRNTFSVEIKKRAKLLSENDYIEIVHTEKESSNNTNKKTSIRLFSKPRQIKKRTDVIDACYAVYESGIPFQLFHRDYLIGDYRKTLDTLADMIFTYFNYEASAPNNEKNFDMFHQSLCDTFLTNINTLRLIYHLPDLKYGNAQKLINMSFKYLSCYDDYLNYADLFSHCHMPIDAYIIVYFATNSVAPLCTGKLGKKGAPFNAKYDQTPWTKLTKPQYLDLLSNYRAHLNALYPDFSMLHLEFYIWPSVKSGILSPITPTPTTPATPIPQFHM